MNTYDWLRGWVRRQGWRRAVAPAGLSVALTVGCASMTPTEQGILGGAGIGGVTGAVVGHALGNTAAGAAIGAGVGGLSGGLVGNAVEKSEQRQEARLAAATAPRGPLGLTDVAQMAQQRISDEVIISQIRTTGSVYQLSPTDIVWLKQNGVSDAVVQEMQATAVRPRRYAAAPVYAVPAYTPVYVVEPPPPPVAVGFGVGFGGPCRHRW